MIYVIKVAQGHKGEMLRFPFALLMSSTGIVKLQIYANLTSFEMHLLFE